MLKTLILKTLRVFPTNWVQALIHSVSLLRHGYTVGVRVLVTDPEEKTVLLVRHTYLPDWYLPGGGVNPGETMEEAAVREVREELGVEATERALLLGLYLNRKGLGRDHIGFFHMTQWVPGKNYLEPNEEIAEARSFPVDDLPSDLSKATRIRLKALLEGALKTERPQSGYWD